MKRRNVLMVLAAALLSPASVRAQQSKRVPIVGMLITHPPVTDPVVEAVRTGLRQYGYEDGKNIKLEVRTALGQLDRVPAIAQEFVQLKVDIIVVANDPALRAVLKATSTIPIVMTGYTDDPTAMGWIESFRRPGKNVTGAFTVNAALIAKRLELIKEMLPKVSRVAVFWDRTFGLGQLEEAQRVAPQLGLQLQPIEVRSPDELPSAIVAARQAKADALLLVWSPVFYVNRKRMAMLALEAKLPLITDMSVATDAGGLLSYGSFGYVSFMRAGRYIDRLLKGSTPSDLAVEFMENIKLVVNSTTAKALGIKIPESILVRADEVVR
jgi:putative tryptophan/tyrosine transport system substrate-binding protein